MILSLTGTWSINPRGPLREAEDAEDLWSLINSIGSIMSGAALSPWFVGETNDSIVRTNGEVDTLILEIYAADDGEQSVVSYLPSIMLATAIGLEKAYAQVKLSQIAVELHPGERPASISAPWWGNFFNEEKSNTTWNITVSPPPPYLARNASSALPYLFQEDGGKLMSTSWGIMEAAALISIFTEESGDWNNIVINSTVGAKS